MSEVKNYSLIDLANSLATASKIAKELQIDISALGFWRKVIVSNTLGHTLAEDADAYRASYEDF